MTNQNPKTGVSPTAAKSPTAPKPPKEKPAQPDLAARVEGLAQALEAAQTDIADLEIQVLNITERLSPLEAWLSQQLSQPHEVRSPSDLPQTQEA